MEQITKPHCGARLDRLPDCRWHSSMFAIVAFGLLVCWSNAVGGLILAQLKALGWTDNSTTATFSAITTAGMFLGALVGGIIGDKTGRRNAFILYEAIHIASMVVGAFSPNMDFLIACRFVMGVGLGALLVTLFAGFTEYMPGRNRGTWSSRVSFIGNWSYPLCSLIAMGLTPLISAEWNWRVTAIDTIGAGDNFASGFIAALLEGKNLRECARFANATAAISVLSVGATTGVKNRKLVEQLLEEYEG